ncbi:Mbov_0392 family ICE element protein [Mycoplasma putrefaciens]|uniref:Mbov_0392 family ICE element protein n=1 Tax=Mycoplasma putrefaciens TaxID=2123 RepID=UPI0003A0EC0D|nr:hypothetical protein [Mycoplasma putrefaciens]
MKYIEDKDLQWLTQYASIDYTDEQVFKIINEAIANSNEEDRNAIAKQLVELVYKMQDLDDEINQKIYEKLKSNESFSLSELEKTNEFFNRIDTDELEEVANEFSLNSFDQFCEENEIISSETLKEWIDSSLKERGLSSYYINLVEPWLISKANYVIINDYTNGFLKEYYDGDDKLEKEYKKYLTDQFIDELELKDTLIKHKALKI